MGTSPAGEDGGIVTQAPDRTTRSSVPRGILVATAKAQGLRLRARGPRAGTHALRVRGHGCRFPEGHARPSPAARPWFGGSSRLSSFLLAGPPSSLFACRRSRASRKLLGRGAWVAPPSRLCFATCLYLTPARRLEMILPRNGRAFSRRGAVSHVTETSRVLFSGFILPPPLSRPATRSRSFWDLPLSLALNRTMTRSGTELLEAVSF